MRTSKIRFPMVCLVLIVLIAGCAGTDKATKDITVGVKKSEGKEPVTILIAAAASMEKPLNELIPLFEEEYSWVTVEGTYDSSGKLQTQIEEGLEADIFLSAAWKQMNTLVDKGFIESESVVNLLKNKIVLIVPTSADEHVSSFEDILSVESIAIGDPESVPAGQYAKMVFEHLGIYEEVLEKASLGTNVTQVLNWVAEGSADAGVVYATDAATTDQVKIVAEVPEGSLPEDVIYPVGILSASEKQEAAHLFVEFLQGGTGSEVFERYGFTANSN